MARATCGAYDGREDHVGDHPRRLAALGLPERAFDQRVALFDVPIVPKTPLVAPR